METLVRYFNVRPPTPYSAGTQYSAGDIIARGWIDAGDHVFVDKVSYNLHMPHRGEVFVFSTRGILGIDLDRLLRQQGVDPPTAQLLLSIERQLRQQAVEQPPPSSAAQILLRVEIERLLRQQGVEGSEFYIKRLAGLPLDNLRVASPLLYVNGHLAQEFGFQRVMNDKIPDYDRGYTNPSPVDAWYLTSPDATYTVPAGHYFAMGDNSANSLDGRYWGPVPQENLMGRGLFVYWPFLPHWGLVR